MEINVKAGCKHLVNPIGISKHQVMSVWIINQPRM